jgi:hypothetical protein
MLNVYEHDNKFFELLVQSNLNISQHNKCNLSVCL